VLGHSPRRQKVTGTDSILTLKDMLDLYLSTSQLTETYISWYATVALAVAGFMITDHGRNLRNSAKVLISLVFSCFSFGTLLAVFNKQSLHSALGYEIKNLVTSNDKLVLSNELKAELGNICTFHVFFTGDNCLYAPNTYATIGGLGVIAICIVFIIFFGGLVPER
jgi:hypothetical protein